MSIDRDSLRRVIWSSVVIFLALAVLEWFPLRSAVLWLDLSLLGRVLATAALLELIVVAARGGEARRVVPWIAVFLAGLLLGGLYFGEYGWAPAVSLGLLGAAALLSEALRKGAANPAVGENEAL